MIEDADARFAFDLSRREALMLARLCRQARRKAERYAANHPFTPEPGRRHAGEVHAARYDELQRRLMTLVRSGA